MAKQTKLTMVVSISKVQVTTNDSHNQSVNVCYNHAIMYNPYDNSNPLSIQTYSNVYIMITMQLL